MSLKLFIITTLLPIVFGLNGRQLIEYAVKQYSQLNHTLRTGVEYPNDGFLTDDTWISTPGTDQNWTAGFYPGVLWNLYNYTNDDMWKQLAIEATEGVAEHQFRNDSHDIGFIIMCSYGKGYELTNNSDYIDVIVNSAHSLAKRFNPIVGCTKSWGPIESEKFLVIVDNMMNLELLFKGYELSGNKTLYDMAVSHANRTLKEHVREDYSSYHIVEFNHTTGAVNRRRQGQGYNVNSTWSRGQAWLVNGFTTAYKYTKSEHFLEGAQRLANYYVEHLPEDGIAHWDFNVPQHKHPYIPRDTSSAAIAASALFELFGHTKNETYLESAKHIMKSLSSVKYRANGKAVYKLPALLANSTIRGRMQSPTNQIWRSFMPTIILLMLSNIFCNYFVTFGLSVSTYSRTE